MMTSWSRENPESEAGVERPPDPAPAEPDVEQDVPADQPRSPGGREDHVQDLGSPAQPGRPPPPEEHLSGRSADSSAAPRPSGVGARPQDLSEHVARTSTNRRMYNKKAEAALLRVSKLSQKLRSKNPTFELIAATRSCQTRSRTKECMSIRE